MFSAAVRAEQACRGSRDIHARRAAAGRFAHALSADGQPYVQHRGGPPGFLKVLNTCTVAFAEYAGNKQYISIGNLAENERSFLFLMDYAEARRLKLWGRARVTGNPTLLARLADSSYSARVEQAIVFTVLAWDWNCSQHIPRLVPAERAR